MKIQIMLLCGALGFSLSVYADRPDKCPDAELLHKQVITDARPAPYGWAGFVPGRHHYKTPQPWTLSVFYVSSDTQSEAIIKLNQALKRLQFKNGPHEYGKEYVCVYSDNDSTGFTEGWAMTG